MKSKILFACVVLTILYLASSFVNQQSTPKFIQFNNFSASFEVPVGKTWAINQIFSSFTSEANTNSDGTSSYPAIRIFIKTLNGDIKTDYQGNRFGPQVYQSNNTAATISYPIILPEKTSFSLIILKGDPGNCSTFDGTGYMSYYELTNDEKQ